MNFSVNCALDYTLQDPAVFLFALECIETAGQRVLREELNIDPCVPRDEFRICGGMNRFSRISTTQPGFLKVSYHAEVCCSPRFAAIGSLVDAPVGGLSPDAIQLLFPSRYCPSDRLRQMAKELFGHLSTQHAIASAVSDWIFANIAYVSGSSGENCSALDTLDLGQGVCRDFAHLGIAFCRAMNVPARYMTCYAHQLDPQDFHACFEVCIGGTWYLFDATRLAPLNGLVRIATGRDAADAAVCTIFGNPLLTRSLVACECADPGFIPVTAALLAERDEAVYLP